MVYEIDKMAIYKANYKHIFDIFCIIYTRITYIYVTFNDT